LNHAATGQSLIFILAVKLERWPKCNGWAIKTGAITLVIMLMQANTLQQVNFPKGEARSKA